MPRNGDSTRNFQRATPNIVTQNHRKKLGSREVKAKVHKEERAKLRITKATKEIARERVLPVNWWLLSLGLLLALVAVAGLCALYDPFGWFVDKKSFRFKPVVTPLIQGGVPM
eukprot:g1390.t1